MARPVTLLVVFFLGFNLFAGMLTATGVDAVIGVDADVGENQQAQNLQDNADQVSTGSSLGGTLFGMYNVLASSVGDFFNYVFPGLAMLARAGVPGYITGGFLGPIFTFLIAVDVISFLRGWGL